MEALKMFLIIISLIIKKMHHIMLVSLIQYVRVMDYCMSSGNIHDNKNIFIQNTDISPKNFKTFSV